MKPNFFRKNKTLFAVSSAIILIIVSIFVSGIAFFLFCILLILFSLYPVFLYFGGKFYRLPDISDYRIPVQTQDGWNIIVHLHNAKEPLIGRYPIILSHGLATNKFSVDLDESHSLAYYLKKKGYTVFVLNLRGVGNSYHDSPKRYKDFCFDDIVDYDVPAVIKKVKELTGSPKINWIGHSMGAMIAQAFLGKAQPDSKDIACFISLGGPGNLEHVNSGLLGFIAHYRKLFGLFDIKFLAKLFSPFFGRIPSSLDMNILSKKDIDEKTISRILYNAAENIAEGLAQQLSSWVCEGKEVTRDDSFNYRFGLKNIQIPSLFISGEADEIAPPQSINFAFNQIQSEEKKHITLSKKNNFSVDYSHMGLVVGRNATHEVFPLIGDWLENYGCENSSVKKKWFFKKQN